MVCVAPPVCNILTARYESNPFFFAMLRMKMKMIENTRMMMEVNMMTGIRMNIDNLYALLYVLMLPINLFRSSKFICNFWRVLVFYI